jgi:CRISPR system Cascade subunit CasC
MMGITQFNSACFYRYSVLHWEQLRSNLQNDQGLARDAVDAFMHASWESTPSGKQNSFAAYNPPSLVYVAVRDQGAPWSLANAFEHPIQNEGRGYIEASIRRLNEYNGRVRGMYAHADPILASYCSLDHAAPLNHLGHQVDSLPKLANSVVALLGGQK